MNEGSYHELPMEIRNWIGEQLFERVPNNVVVINRDFDVLAANNNFRQVFGEPDGKHCYELYKHADKICENCMAAHTFEDGKPRVNDETGVDCRGRPAHYVVHIAPVFDETGQVAYITEMSYDVTETKSLQREYNILFERVPCYMAVINRDLQIVKANELLRQTFGKTTGEHCYEVYKQRTERCTDCPALKTFADGQSHKSEQVGISKKGQPTYYSMSTAPLSRSGREFSHVIEMATDSTSLHALSEDLVRKSEFQRILINNTLDALVATDVSGKVQVFNQAAEKLFDTPANKVIGVAPAGRFLPREFLDVYNQGADSLTLSETTIKNSKGEEIPVRFSGSALRDEGDLIGGAAFFLDLREIKRLEREKLDNERLAAVGQTVAQLAHGIKNILTGLQGGMYVIKSGMRSESQKKIDKGWEMLDRNVDRITQLVKGFLSFSKGYVPKARLVDPNDIGRGVYLLFKDAAGKKGIKLQFKPGRAIEPASMDQEEIRSCLENLVSNAIDACQTSDNKGCIVRLRVAEKGDTLVFEVNDTGCGMDYDIKNKVFTTFFTTKGLGGTGLGLMVTRKIVQEHGGRIQVESTPGKGSTFRIEFPRSRLPEPTT